MTKYIYVFIVTFIFNVRICGQKNVVLIIADDLGTDYFGFYENAVDTVPVPNIRKLLNRGIRFKNAMSNPVCSSTRSTILTGQYAFRTGVGGIVGGEGGSGTLNTSEKTIPKLLEDNNPTIAKANIGKWHLHNAMPVSNLQNPLVMGYDHYEGSFIGQLASYTNWTKHTNGIASNITTYATTETVNNAVTWLNSLNHDNPFFLWLAFNAPHAPYHLPPAQLHTYNLSGTMQDINSNPKKYFKASLQALDTEIGRFIDSLSVHNKLETTDFIFIGDNGNTTQTAQTADTERAKGTIYQYGVHVPLIIAGPSVINPGRVSEALVNSVDLFSTILELMEDGTWQNQIPANKTIDSKSLLPIIMDKADEVRPWSFTEIFKNTPDDNDGKGIRNQEYKLMQFDNGKEEFYHIFSDENETTNLLNTIMSSDAIENYRYLCEEKAKLLNSSMKCDIPTQVNILSNEKNFTINNLFHERIEVDPLHKILDFVLYNSLGDIIYLGSDISSLDCSGLPPGIYFAKPCNGQGGIRKLIKY